MTEHLGYSTYRSLSIKYGSSFFVFDPIKLRSNYRSLYSGFRSFYPKVQIGYSYKTNYTPWICRILQDEGAWAEVVSEMEYSAALRLGTPSNKIIFNGPYKADWAFREAALGGAILNLDSHRDLDLLALVSAEAPAGANIRVVLRTNFPIDSRISRFGFDTESSDFSEAVNIVSTLPNVDFMGLHCHFPNRGLDSFRSRAENLVSLCKKVFPSHPPKILNIGGGFFSDLPETLLRTMSERPATFADYGAVIGKIFTKAFPDPHHSPLLFLEPGTALVANVLDFYTQVVSTKSIRGKHFATVAGSIFDVSPNAKIRSLPVTSIFNPELSRGAARDYSVVGFTCIESDILTESLVAPLMSSDVLVYGNVGSYSIVMRPPFILPSSAVLMKNNDGTDFVLIKSPQTNQDVFSLYHA